MSVDVTSSSKKQMVMNSTLMLVQMKRRATALNAERKVTAKRAHLRDSCSMLLSQVSLRRSALRRVRMSVLVTWFSQTLLTDRIISADHLPVRRLSSSWISSASALTHAPLAILNAKVASSLIIQQSWNATSMTQQPLLPFRIARELLMVHVQVVMTGTLGLMVNVGTNARILTTKHKTLLGSIVSRCPKMSKRINQSAMRLPF